MIKEKQNLHTHTSYCDGADTPKEVIDEALKRGFTSIGFSGHSYMHYAPEYSMSIEGTQEYIKDITRLKEDYSDKIDIFCGLEVDMYSEIDLTGYDYLIGSAHYFLIEGKYIGFDRSEQVVRDIIDNYFGGDGLEYAKEYYKTLAMLPKYGDFDIVGHFDLITKHSENTDFFDQNCKEYKKAVTNAAEALAGKISFFEVNTGAIARGYRKTPYPTEYILNLMRDLGFGAVVTSDCHNKTMLDCYFEESDKLLKKCGFNEKYILTNDGFKPVEIKI